MGAPSGNLQSLQAAEDPLHQGEVRGVVGSAATSGTSRTAPWTAEPAEDRERRHDQTDPETPCGDRRHRALVTYGLVTTAVGVGYCLGRSYGDR